MLEAPSGAEERHAPLAREANPRQRAVEAAIGRAGRCPQSVEGRKHARAVGGDGVRCHPLIVDGDAEPLPAVLDRDALSRCEM